MNRREREDRWGRKKIYTKHENAVSIFGGRRLVVGSSMVHFNWSLILMMPKRIVLKTLRRLTAKPLDSSTPTNPKSKENAQHLHGYLQLLDPSIKRSTESMHDHLSPAANWKVFPLAGYFIVILLLTFLLDGRYSFLYEV